METHPYKPTNILFPQQCGTKSHTQTRLTLIHTHTFPTLYIVSDFTILKLNTTCFNIVLTVSPNAAGIQKNEDHPLTRLLKHKDTNENPYALTKK
jgi:hypothetical protein